MPSGVATPFADEVAQARNRVPQRLEASALGAEVDALDATHWRLCLPAEPGDRRDLFVEPPRGYWLTAAAAAAAPGRECFTLALRESPSGATFPIPVAATIVGKARAIETSLNLNPKP